MNRQVPNSIAGVILAGGLSRRMGGSDKAFLPLGGRPLIAQVLERLASQVETIAISANGDLSRFAPFNVPVFSDAIDGYLGPLAGIYSAMRWAEGRQAGYTHVVTAAADTPFFPEDLAARLVANAATPRTIVMACSAGHRQPVFALWPLSLAGDLSEWLKRGETLKVGAWASRHELAEAPFPMLEDGTDPFFNINTPDDLAAAGAILGERA
ncbi:molybdenum cofactor guanylyltransferase MobA [Oricola thermophila]|uniref:Molybdenum cofactor guanylyltransferase n=1 Tax=Oricola thermophila TaxID=2742145 RepID=A0A6N1VFA4_9HYPH|nr:molybdenum cofactor guanylyltransferase MobA [Oricola thermophila]QKV17647.1 molybdenum cofactor guanylyltransferase MobA [Oricola thermophila]